LDLEKSGNPEENVGGSAVWCGIAGLLKHIRSYIEDTLVKIHKIYKIYRRYISYIEDTLVNCFTDTIKIRLVLVKKITETAMVAWPSGIVSACGAMGREIESHLGICTWVVAII
jgi:hypothetical protein